MKKMNTRDLIKAVSEEAHISESAVEKVLNSMRKVIAQELYTGGEVVLREFGKFSTSVRKPHEFYNVHAGKHEMMTKSHTVVRFIPSTVLKDFVN